MNMSDKKRKKHIASIENPTFEAITGGFFRFETEAQAVTLMQRLSEQFFISTDQEPLGPNGCPTLKIWIRGFDISPQEATKGYRGNYARIVIKKLPEARVTLIAEKIPTALKTHPRREQPKRRHPNNGHPLLRAVARGKAYTDIEQARMDLLHLHEEFPETSIPGRDKVHLLIYSRDFTPPIRKATLRIIPVSTGGYKLELTDNSRKVEAPPELEVNAPVPAPVKTDGKFTSMVALQRKKKPAVKKPKKSEKKQ